MHHWHPTSPRPRSLVRKRHFGKHLQLSHPGNTGHSGSPHLISVSVWLLPQEASLRQISEGLQLHQALLANISKALDPKCQDPPLLYDIRDLDEQISEVCVCVAD